MAVKRSFVQKKPHIFEDFSLKPPVTTEPFGGYMSFIWLSFRHEAYMAGY